MGGRTNGKRGAAIATFIFMIGAGRLFCFFILAIIKDGTRHHSAHYYVKG
jgi:GH24 family phage-related lysozyme (muramidase)